MPISERTAAAQQFQRRSRLTAKGRQLDLTATLSTAGLRDGDVVTAVVQLGKLAATHHSFAWYGHGAKGAIQKGAETAARCKSR